MSAAPAVAATFVPDFSRITQEQRHQSDLFFDYTSHDNIENYAKGSSLTDLVDLAEAVVTMIGQCNPFWAARSESETERNALIQARQWQLDRISDVKQRIAEAIEQKKAYYDNHCWGIITKFILKLFCMWHQGNTYAIFTAENFLLFWDSRMPVYYSNGRYQDRFFFPITPVAWVQQNLNTDTFYNYTPSRAIEIGNDVHRGLVLPDRFVRV